MWGLDEIGQHLSLGIAVCSIFAAIGFYRHHTLNDLAAFNVFLAVTAGYLGVKLLLSGLKGSIADIPPAILRLYVVGVGVLAVIITINSIVQALKKLFEPPDKKDDKDSN